MNGYPVTIRLLDPPLHEFMPEKEEDIIALADRICISCDELRAIIKRQHEINPMMGLRGVRLAVIYPEIAKMQTRAIIEAAINVNRKGMNVVPEIMVPLVCEAKELKYVKSIIFETAEKVIKEAGVELTYLVGTMMEIPRAVLTADEIAIEADFFSFGTNDLTQMTYGLSRDDAGRILDEYYQKKIFEFDPTARLDQKGVGKLVKMGVDLGRGAKADIKLGVCGEHGGDPSSIEFFHKIGLNYVSCHSGTTGKVAAAQAVISNKN